MKLSRYLPGVPLLAWIVAMPLAAQVPTADSFNPRADGPVLALAVQADEKVLVGGSFTMLGGQPREHIGRVNRDGTLDHGFNPGANGAVLALALQPDGKILVSGQFSMLGGHTRHRIGRLHSDGTLDMDFNPMANPQGPFGWIRSVLVQPDGRILAGGAFSTQWDGHARSSMARINSDGTLDVDFNPGFNGQIYTIVVQPDGRILAGGGFTQVNYRTRNSIARLHADGSLDADFYPQSNNQVHSMVVQPDGRIVMGGSFISVGREPVRYLARLNADGTLDRSFIPSPEAPVYALALQTDGRILVGYGIGRGTAPASSIVRLHADGTQDTSFDPQTDGYIFSLAVQPDGKLLAGGSFNTPDQHSFHIARFHESHPATEALTFETGTLTWTRGGSGPQFWRTSFEYSTDGETWTLLGQGAAIEGGWELGGVLFPAEGTVRARGYVAGDSTGSGWFVESTIPVSRSFAFLTSTAGFNDGRFGFHFTGPSGQEVIIESSRDFRTWIPVWTNTFNDSPLFWFDPHPDAPRSRFYRLRY